MPRSGMAFRAWVFLRQICVKILVSPSPRGQHPPPSEEGRYGLHIGPLGPSRQAAVSGSLQPPGADRGDPHLGAAKPRDAHTVKTFIDQHLDALSGIIEAAEVPSARPSPSTA